MQYTNSFLGGAEPVYHFNETTIRPTDSGMREQFDWGYFQRLTESDARDGRFSGAMMAISFLDTIRAKLQTYNFSLMDDVSTQKVANLSGAATQIVNAINAAYPDGILDDLAFDLELLYEDIIGIVAGLQERRTIMFTQHNQDFVVDTNNDNAGNEAAEIDAGLTPELSDPAKTIKTVLLAAGAGLAAYLALR